ncbi:MAG: GAF domain-containing protein [Chloroflexia bacterium]|nr:GAF domain-containing protein [Chloroflexia bacterium]
MHEDRSTQRAEEQQWLSELAEHLRGRLPALLSQWELVLDQILQSEGIEGIKGVRRESLAAAEQFLGLMADESRDSLCQRGEDYGSSMARQELSHALVGRWLLALRQSLLDELSRSHEADPRQDRLIILIGNIFSEFMLCVMAGFGNQQQRMLVEQQRALQQAYEQAQRRIVEQKVLNEIGQALSSTIELEALWELVYEQTGRLMDTTSFYIALCDWEKQRLQFVLQFENGQREAPDSQAISSGLTGHIAQTGEILHLPHGPEDFLQERGIQRIGRAAKSWLGVPMVVQDRVIGVIAVQSYSQPGAYDEGHKQLLSTVAAQAAVAVENARLYGQARQQAEEMAAFYHIGVTASSQLDLEQVLEAIYEQASLVMDTSAFFVALYEDERDEISFPLVYDKDERLPPFQTQKSTAGGLTGWLLEYSAPLLVRDWEKDATAELQQVVISMGDPVRSLLAVPMVVRGETIGVIAAQSYEPNAFEAHHQQVLEMIANQAAAAIGSVRLYQTARRQVEELTALQQISLKLAATTELSEVLEAIADSAMELLRPNDVVIYLYNAAGHKFTLATGLRLTGERGMVVPMPRSDGITAAAARTGEIQVIENVGGDPGYEPPSDQATKIHSIAGIPLLRAGEVLGVLNVAYYETHHFSPAELRLLQSLADQAAVAVSNASLFRKIQAMMGELQETAEAQSQLLDLVQELSTPVVPLLEQVLLMPLVGSIDSTRGRQILDRLLAMVEKEQAQVVLVDITGVPIVDTSVAQILLHAVQAVRLLGGEVVLVGITPEVAQTLVSLGVDLSGITTRSDLQGGVGYAMARAARKRGKKAGLTSQAYRH